jgi:hypothetical protein
LEVNGLETFYDPSFKNASHSDRCGGEGVPSLNSVFMHPDEVVGDVQLTLAEKREILASWASDVRAVPNKPAWRQLDNGNVIHIDEILKALRSLDGDAHQAWASDRRGSFAHGRRGRSFDWRKAILRRNHSEDDDDPPPCPAMIAIPPRKPLSSGSAVDLGLALAA